MGGELNKTTRSRLERLTLLVDNLKVDTVGGLGGHTAHLPGRCVSDTNLGLSHRRRLLVGGYSMSYQSTDLELLGCLFEGIYQKMV